MKNTYFLSIDSNNLGLYFSSAIIVPHKYIEDPIEDIQSLNKDYILLSKKKFSDKSDCCLELVLTDTEAELLLDNGQSCYQFGSALPTTRVSAIYFYSKDKMENTIDLARSSSFIPERLIKVINKQIDDFFEIKSCVFKVEKDANNINNKIDIYNKYLGGFSFMKMGGEDYMNYSKNYFSTLAFFNNNIRKEVEQADRVNSLKLEYNYQGLFNNDDKEWLEWRKIIFGSHKNIVSTIGAKVPVKNGVYQQNEVINNKKLYILSVLANYGTDPIKPKRTESLIRSLITNNLNYKEAIALFFGLNTGYKKLKKSYSIENNNWSIKFELKSKLDYFTIESIFQLVFNRSVNSDLSFLDKNIPENIKLNIDTNKFRTYKILDENIIYDKKPSSIKELFDEFMRRKYFTKTLTSLTRYFAKKNEIILSKEQSEKMNSKYFSVIENPLKEYLTQLKQEVFVFYEKMEAELQVKYNNLKQQYNEISTLLKKADRTLFDEIDTNGDGELSQKEIGIFMDKIINAKKQLEIELRESSIKVKKNNVSKEYIEIHNSTSKVSEQNVNYSDNDEILKIHRYYLPKLSITELGKIAKSKNIVSKQKDVSKQNYSEIIDKIIENIKSDNKLI